MTAIPPVLAERGEIFVPIEPKQKFPTVPRDDEHLHAADDPIMQAYLENDHNYGVVCRGDLAVLDADEPDRLIGVIDALPTTVWQKSGSRSSEHYFLEVPGLDGDIPLDDPRSNENVGHIKGAAQSLVVGPSSRHDSGNRYGPLHNTGSGIATIEEDDLRALIEPYTRDDERAGVHDAIVSGIAHAVPASREALSAIVPEVVDAYLGESIDADTGSDGPTLTSGDVGIYDVIDESKYPAGARRGHPFHGSETNKNFMVHADGESWRCWHHGVGGYAAHLVGMEEGIVTCQQIAATNGRLDSKTWRKIFDAGREAGYDFPTPREAVKLSPDTPRCPECDWALGEHRRDPFDASAFRCERCSMKVSEDDAYAHAE